MSAALIMLMGGPMWAAIAEKSKHMNELRSRRGSIKITRRMFFENLNELHELFKWLEFLPLEGMPSFDEDCTTLIGLSPRFDKVPEGACAIQYTVDIHYQDGNCYFTLSNGVTNLVEANSTEEDELLTPAKLAQDLMETMTGFDYKEPPDVMKNVHAFCKGQ